MQTITCLNLCTWCINILRNELKEGNEIAICNLSIKNQNNMNIVYTPIDEIGCVSHLGHLMYETNYSNLEVLCAHSLGRAHYHHDYLRDRRKIKGILLKNRIKLTNDARRYIVHENGRHNIAYVTGGGSSIITGTNNMANHSSISIGTSSAIRMINTGNISMGVSNYTTKTATPMPMPIPIPMPISTQGPYSS